MASAKRTIVRLETHSVSVIRPAGSAVDIWCEECAAVVPMVTPEHAAEMSKTKLRTIYQQVERGELHFVETGAGELLICCESLRVE